MGLKKILFERVALPFMITASTLTFFQSNADAQTKNQTKNQEKNNIGNIGYYDVNVPLTEILKKPKISNIERFKQGYYIGKSENFDRDSANIYLTIIPINKKDYPVFFYLNPGKDTITGVQLKSAFYSERMLNDIIIPVLGKKEELISLENYRKFLEEGKKRAEIAELNRQKIKKEKEKYVFLDRLSREANCRDEWHTEENGILEMQKKEFELKDINIKIAKAEKEKDEKAVEQLKELEKLKKEAEFGIKEQENTNTKNEKKIADRFFESLAGEGFALHSIPYTQLKDSANVKTIYPGETFSLNVNPSKKETNYITFLFGDNDRLEHNVLILKNKKGLAQISLITSKTDSPYFEKIIKPYLDNKNNFHGEMHVFMGKYNLPFWNLLELCAEKNYKIRHNWLKINKEEKEICVGIGSSDGEAFLLKGSEYAIDRGTIYNVLEKEKK